MRKNLFIVSLMALMLWPAYGQAFSTKGQDCSKCHTLSREEAAGLLRVFFPSIKILEIRKVPVKSLWEVDIEVDGKRNLVFIDFSKKYLLSGALVDLKTKQNLTEERQTELTKVDVSKIPLKDALVLGNKYASRKVIVFIDPD